MAKILLLTYEFPPAIGGIGTYVEQLAAAATAIGHHITVFAPTFGKSDFTTSSNNTYTVKRFPATSYKPTGMPVLLVRTKQIISNLNPDIIHAVDIPFTLACAILGKYRSLPFISSVHGAASFSVHNSTTATLFGVTDLYARAERIIANSAFTRRLVLDHYENMPPDRVTIAHLGVDPFWFSQVIQTEIDSMKDRYGIPRTNKILLTVARLDRRKGHRFVFEAIERLPESIRSNLTYLIVGGGTDEPLKAELKHLASQSSAQIIFAGSVTRDNLRPIYAAANACCMPGDSKMPGVEGFGLAYLEAAAMGVPSIAFNIASAPEVIRNGETGILTPHLDIDALASAIERLIGTPDEARRMGDAAKRWAAQFTWAHCAELTYGPVVQ